MVYEILTKFTPVEFNSFLDKTGTGTNSRKISSMIRKRNGDITRDEIFKRIFKKKRDVKNDHLLRNELSVLKKKLELFIIENSVTDIPVYADYYKPYVLAQWCIKRTLVKEAEKYIHQALLIAKQKNAWQGLLKINKTLFQTTHYGKSSYHYKKDLLASISEDHLHYLKEYVAEEVRYAGFIKAGAYKLSANLRKTDLIFEDTSVFEVKLYNSKNRVAQFYYLKSQAYLTSGLTAVELLKKALLCLDEKLELFLKEEERLACMSAIAMEYSVAGDFKQAAAAFEQLIFHPEFENFTAKHALLFNYCTTLLKIKEYKKAIKYLDILDTLDIEPVVKERIYTMKCNCYIFMDDVEGIKKILPGNLQSFDLGVRLYYRILYIIYYILKQDLEMAERELANIKQVKNVAETPYTSLVRLFERFLDSKAAYIYKEKNRKKKLEILNNELHSFQNDLNAENRTLPAVWLIEKTQQFILQPE